MSVALSYFEILREKKHIFPKPFDVTSRKLAVRLDTGSTRNLLRLGDQSLIGAISNIPAGHPASPAANCGLFSSSV